MKSKKDALQYIITAAIGLVIAAVIICTGKIWTLETKDILHLLINAFFAPGVFIAGIGLLVFASNEGAFDMLGFAVTKLADLFRRDYKSRKYKDFYEYRNIKHENAHSMAFMLIVGVVFIAVSLILTAVYYI